MIKQRETRIARDWGMMKFGLVLDCAETTGQAVWTYLESLGLSPTEVIAVCGVYRNRDPKPAFLAERNGGYVFYAPERSDIGYDSFLAYGGRQPEKPLRRPGEDRRRHDRLCVMVSFLRRCGCKTVIAALDQKTMGDPPYGCRVILLPSGLCRDAAANFLRGAEQKLLPMLLFG